jgi:hypothetical protein
MTGLRVAGVPVDLRADGVVIAGTPLTAPDALPADDVLAQAGVSIERLPDVRTVTPDGQIAEMRVGGVRFTFTQPQAEVTFSVTFGDLVARTRVLDLAEPVTLDLPSLGPVNPPVVVAGPVGPPLVAGEGRPIEPPTTLATRHIIRTSPVGGGDWIAVAAIAALAAPMSLIVRRAFRAASRP